MPEELENVSAAEQRVIARRIADELELDRIPSDDDHLAGFGVDSLGLFNLVCLVEELAGCAGSIEASEYPILETFGDVLSYFVLLKSEPGAETGAG